MNENRLIETIFFLILVPMVRCLGYHWTPMREKSSKLRSYVENFCSSLKEEDP